MTITSFRHFWLVAAVAAAPHARAQQRLEVGLDDLFALADGTSLQIRISDATGSTFSLLPVDNATGNFVKVEQRVTVRILLEGNGTEELALLRAGYNVECEVAY